MLVLDTNVLIEMERKDSRVIEKLARLWKNFPGNLFITSAVYAEFLFGFLKIGKEQAVEKYLHGLEVLNFDLKSAKIFAIMKKSMEDSGRIIPIFDLVTACIVSSNNATLITFDRHFEGIPNLKTIFL